MTGEILTIDGGKSLTTDTYDDYLADLQEELMEDKVESEANQ
jgi:hypothetical protein